MAISVISPPPPVLNCHFAKQDDGSYSCNISYSEINKAIYNGAVVTGEARINNESGPTQLFYAQQSEYYINFVCIESIAYSRNTLASVRINKLLQSTASSNTYYYSSMLIDSVNTFSVYDYDSSIGFYYIKYSKGTPDWDSFTSRISSGQIILSYDSSTPQQQAMEIYYYPTGKGNRTAGELEFVSISDDLVTTDKFLVLQKSKQTVEGKILLRRETTTKVLSNDFKKQTEDNVSQSPLTGIPYLNEITQTYSLSDANHDKLQQLCSPNLKDNWYFPNPVNQRNGHVVPPKGPGHLYSDAACTLLISGGTIDAYRQVTPVSTGNYSYSVDGGTYYVKASDVVPGYTGIGYTIDRWKLAAWNANSIAMIVEADGVRLIGTSNSANSAQLQESTQLLSFAAGAVVTASILVTALGANGASPRLLLYKSDGTSIGSCIIESVGLHTLTVAIPADAGNSVILAWGQDASLGGFGNTDMTVKAVKLELGSVQTLAHQDANGAWVLNEIPDYGEQLRRCQRYFVRLSDGYADNGDICGVGYASTPNEVRVMVPLPCDMRSKPAVTCENIVTDTGGLLGLKYPGWNTKSTNLLTLVFNSVNTTDTNVVRFGVNGYIDVSADL